jgi:hypothetical protein
MVLRAWARSNAANSTWLNLIGTCVGYQLEREIIEVNGEIRIVSQARNVRYGLEISLQRRATGDKELVTTPKYNN